MQLNHNCLRPIVNGGLDPVDGFPWIVARWWDGIVLSDRVRDFDLTAEECYRIQGHANSLIEALGPVAGTVAFTPGSIVICGDGEQTIDTFSIDYHSWFAAFAEGIHPADLVDVQVKYKALTTYLRRQAGLSSTPLVSAVEAPSIQPEQSIILPSASNSSSLKILPILALLLGAIGYFGWKLANRDTSAKEKPIVLESKPEPVAPQITSPPTLPILPAKPVERLPQVEPVTEAIPELVPTSRPKSSGGFASVDPTSPYSLDKKIGKWITFETTLDQIDEEGRLIIPDSEIRATLPADSSDLVRSALRNKVTLRGFLASPSALKILKPDDIIVTYLLKGYYTIDDEFQIRKEKLAKSRAIVLDPERDQWERVKTLSSLKESGEIDDEVVSSMMPLWTASLDDPKGGYLRWQLLENLQGTTNSEFRTNILEWIGEEESPKMRSQGLETLAPMANDPNVNEWLEYLAENDPEPGIQERALGILQNNAEGK
ncbi:hypothetical protein OAE39_01565 [Akkermansiaceae bacterium]|nr:hypothetical protein [Akkermansiaceae bacterium]